MSLIYDYEFLLIQRPRWKSPAFNQVPKLFDFLFRTIKTHFSQQRFLYEFEGSTSRLRKTGLHRQFSRELVHIVSPPFTVKSCETAVLIVLGSVCEVFSPTLNHFLLLG